jgi:hypothetical protein
MPDDSSDLAAAGSAVRMIVQVSVPSALSLFVVATESAARIHLGPVRIAVRDALRLFGAIVEGAAWVHVWSNSIAIVLQFLQGRGHALYDRTEHEKCLSHITVLRLGKLTTLNLIWGPMCVDFWSHSAFDKRFPKLGRKSAATYL